MRRTTAKTLVEFRNWAGKHGRFPQKTSTDTFEKELAAWHATMRSRMAAGTLTADTVLILSQIPDFFEPPFDKRFNEQLSKLKAYFQKHKQLPTPTTAVNQEEVLLARWRDFWSAKIRKGAVSDERARLYHEAGFTEIPQPEAQADYPRPQIPRPETQAIAKAVAPAPARAEDQKTAPALAPSGKTPVSSIESTAATVAEFNEWMISHGRFPKANGPDVHERRLALWHAKTRIRRAEGTLSQDTVQLVSSIPDFFEMGRDLKFNSQLSKLKSYIQTHKRLPTQANPADREEIALARWRYHCNDQIRKGTLSAERLRLYREAGFLDLTQEKLVAENPRTPLPQPEPRRDVDARPPTPSAATAVRPRASKTLRLSPQELQWYRLLQETTKFKKDSSQLPSSSSSGSKERQLALWLESNAELIRNGQLDAGKQTLLRRAGLVD